MMYKIAVLPGDGVGPEVTREAVKIVRRVAEVCHLGFEMKEAPVGGVSIDRFGKPLTDETLQLAKDSDCVLLGAVGGPKWDSIEYEKRPEQALLALRRELGAYANIRPAKVFPGLAGSSPLKKEVVEGTDLVVVRELTGGIYFGTPKGIEKLPGGEERGVNTEVYTTSEVKRIAEKAFQLARRRRRKVTSVDKANILESSILWRKVVSETAKSYPDVKLEHLYVDNCAMQLVRNPRQFDVILTPNLFGDILSDEAAIVAGSIGMLPSASLGNHHAIYEPVHGSAPDLAGQDKANPLAAILSVAMMLESTFQLYDVARGVEKAVEKVLLEGYRTQDIHQEGASLVSCSEMGDRVAREIKH
jgi:3-isopropylmalate dehydrogenase